MKKTLLNNLEGIIIFLASFLLTFLFYKYFLDSAYLIYSNSGLNPITISLFGSLLGLLLTAYAIVFSIVPTLNRELLESNHFLRINQTFFISVVATLLLLIFSIVYQFISKPFQIYFLIIYFFLFVLVMMEVILIAIILFLLLKISRKKILSN